MADSFTKWVRWLDRNALPADLGNPGVYALAITSADISGEAFSWLADIAYIGMTNSKGGMRARLRQFDRTVSGGEGHGGGCRVRYVHRDYDELVQKLFVSVRSFECNVRSREPRDLRVMGEVACEEYECFARYAALHGNLPQFNRPKSQKLTASELANKRTKESGT